MKVLSLLLVMICFSCNDKCKYLNEENIRLKKCVKALEENNKFLQEDNNILGSILAEKETNI
tara:strand:+ start:6330 stop:6515 length:186 start_codon:yes stop_codon:yes gene_type:complete